MLAKVFSYFLFLCLFWQVQIEVIADPEMLESTKCSKLFPIFEKKFNIPANTLYSIALKESGKKHKIHKISVVWPWTVNIEGKGHHFNSKKEAISFVKKQIIKGKENIDIGCMQINLRYHPDAFNSLSQAFDPYYNVKYGAKFLRTKYEQLGNWHKAIAHYHSATFSLGNKYRQDVVKIANNMNLYKASLNKFVMRNTSISPNFITSHNKSHNKAKKNFIANSKRYKSNMMVPIPRKGV